MTDGAGRPRRGTPASHLGDHLALITQFTEQARVGLERDSETARVFLSVYCGFLIEAGAGIRWLLEPALIEQATVAIRRLAPAAPVDQQELATRLLATIWAAGVVGGIGASDWARWAPELPAVCLRLARHTTGETL
ncbi:hypothetical protein [Streptomyces melanogenes]|uniref:TetR family transcriptional regulator n=1 Tax=Streptomyces melanogenes TaxID=67326 RepID=A0ABZ1XDH8_9ACTN|nr:hypothetical protein [Streptomyces melanogenes]